MQLLDLLNLKEDCFIVKWNKMEMYFKLMIRCKQINLFSFDLLLYSLLTCIFNKIKNVKDIYYVINKTISNFLTDKRRSGITGSPLSRKSWLGNVVIARDRITVDTFENISSTRRQTFSELWWRSTRLSPFLKTFRFKLIWQGKEEQWQSIFYLNFLYMIFIGVPHLATFISFSFLNN